MTLRTLRRPALTLLIVLVAVAPAFASTSGGSCLPWDGPITTMKNAITGPVALAVSIFALFAAGGALVFGEELGGFVRKALMLVIAISFITLGAGFISNLGLTGALL